MNRYLFAGALAVLSTLALAPAAAAQADAEVSALRSRCARLDGQARTACYDQALLAMLKERGVAPTMAVLDRLGQADAEVRREGHLYAHSIGLAAFRGADQVGATFAECTPIFQSGCYHGVIQSYFSDLMGSAGRDAVTAEAVNALCASYRGSGAQLWLLFQCAHGMGHGLAMVHEHHLPRMLAGCDLLRDAWEREGCYGGAFMENVVQATAPHHGVGRPEVEGAEHGHAAMGHGAAAPAAADEHAGMDHAAMGHDMPAAEAPYKALDRDDPLYPCNTLENRYLRSCYNMQTSAILFFNQGDFAATARACDSVAEDFRTACYQSLGRDVSAYTLQDHARAARLCSNGDAAYQPWCHVGYVKNLVDLDADATTGLAYCRLVAGDDAKTACYRAIGEEVFVLTDDPTARRAWCDRAEDGYRGVCAVAAGLSRERETTNQ